jgi:hypothetical protein
MPVTAKYKAYLNACSNEALPPGFRLTGPLLYLQPIPYSCSVRYEK